MSPFLLKGYLCLTNRRTCRRASNYLKETVIKHPQQAQAERFWNCPLAALEEALVNATYHRSYEERVPVEVRITPQELAILSFPGPDRSIRHERPARGQGNKPALPQPPDRRISHRERIPDEVCH